MRLSQKTLPWIGREVQTGDYDRDTQSVGIVHFGIGAFHRAHQAWYTDAAMNAGERDWMITGVSLRSGSVADQLNPQDGMFTLTERSSRGRTTRVIGSVREVLIAGDGQDAIVARIASPDCHVISFTVTEKGYCRTTDGDLDFEAAAAGFYPIVTDALHRRRAAGLGGLTLLSCDNLSGNGRVLSRLFGEWLEYSAPDLAGWFAAECRTPNSMVDRIVPATTPADLTTLIAQLGLRDEGAVFTEEFSQWVVEDNFAGPRPHWEDYGAQVVADVAPYESAKLRMLNGAHSLLAYCGLQAGHTFVHEAVADPSLRALTLRLMRDEAAPTIATSAGQDLVAYADALLARFANPDINHRLVQIAMDGSQKLPQRWLETLAANQRDGQACPAILQGLAAWICHLRGANGAVDDPLAEKLATAAREAEPTVALFSNCGLLPSMWQPSMADRAVISAHLHR